MNVPETLTPNRYFNTLECRMKIEYGRYLVIRKDGKTHIETFNGTSWAYNANSIDYYYTPKLSD